MSLCPQTGQPRAAWRGHLSTGRATHCGYWTGIDTCRKPRQSGAQPIDCPNCETGTQQARFARLAARAK